ncbi:MAG: DegT/DnrJ/EryC1/StrS family aminotransferase [Acidobacteria bacterium]|nr:DegT/DnrJ/EryC1/StrS family aminotransferase [Acidobacteriota bacterium]
MSTAVATITRKIPVARPFLGIEEEEAVVEALRSGWITQGPTVAQFEDRFAEYIGCDHAIAVSSCTTALHLAIAVAGIGPGDEVICPSLSFIASANSVAYTGATPVFCDIDANTYNIDPAWLGQCLTSRTKAILVVHQIGQPVDMRRILEFADAHKLIVIEDAACAIGSEYRGRLVGAPLGLMACFSFHPRKVLTTGEGGMITTSDAVLAQRLRQLRQHGMSISDLVRNAAKQIVTERYNEIGYNFRMTDLQAAIGLAQLTRLPHFLTQRRAMAARYDHALGNVSWLQPPVILPHCKTNYQSYMVRLLGSAAGARDAIMQTLLDKGISTRRAVMAIHRELPYRAERWERTLSRTNLVADTGLILPLYHDMSEDEQDFVIEAIQEIRLTQ